MRIIGLTGPIGAGKSEVAKILKRHKAHVIEADEIGHQLLAPQSEAWCKIVEAFGSRVLNRGGVVNRHKLGETVFKDREKLKKLNAIMHPGIRAAIGKEINAKKEEGGGKLLVVNAALPHLFSGLVDETWVLIASKEERLKRLLKQGLSRAEAESRMAAQMPQKEYLGMAGRVIKNEGTLKQLKLEIAGLLPDLFSDN